MSTTREHPTGFEFAPDLDVYSHWQASAEFVELRRRFRRFVFPMSAAFLLWYLGYVLLADYAHEFMNTRAFGNLTVGLALGLLQFVTTFLIATVYVRYADRHLDPVATQIRERVEGTRR